MIKEKESAPDYQDFISEQIKITQPQDLFNQTQEKKTNYTRDLATALDQPQTSPQIEGTNIQKKDKKQVQMQKQSKRPSSARNKLLQKKKVEKVSSIQDPRPSTVRQTQGLTSDPSMSNIVQTISKRISNFENQIAELRTLESDIQTKNEEKNSLSVLVQNMKKESITLKSEIDYLNQNLDKIHIQKVGFQKNNSFIENKQASTYLELQYCSRETSDLQQQNAEVEKTLKDTNTQIEFEKKAYEDFNDYIKALKKKINETSKEKDNIKARCVSMQKQSTQLREKLQNQEKETRYFMDGMQQNTSKSSLSSQT